MLSLTSTFSPKIIALFRLMRLHQPTGIWLLLWPCWWGIGFASRDLPSITLLLLFTLGAIIMRSAGCVINDLIDRNIDGNVERTKNRPLVTGEVSVREALLLLFGLLTLGAIILFMLNPLVIWLGIAILIPIFLYPLMKRITYWPQLFLGIVFNWGALMGWVAVTGYLNITAVLLYLAGIFWTLGYDTIYAHQDKISDARIGVKSTALLLGENTKSWLKKFYKGAAILLLLIGGLTQTGRTFYLLWMVGAYHLYWQVQKVNLDNPDDCMAKFRSNVIFGAIIFIAIIANKIM